MSAPLLTRLAAHAQQRPHALAYREVTPPSIPPSSDRTLTYADLLSRASTLSAQLPRRATILLRLPNTLDFPVAFLACLLAGSDAFPVPPDLSPPELDRAARESQAAVVLTPGPTMSPAPHPPTSPSPHPVPSLLLQSSGTTGLPKIVRRPLPTLDAVSANMAASIRLTPEDKVLATVPLCHSYGLEHGLLAPLYAGATVHLAQGFDLHTVLEQLTRERITIFPAVPSQFELLTQLADPDTTFPTLRTPYSAGGPLPPAVSQAFHHKYGLPISQLYGATEIGSVTFSHPTDPHFDPASVGRPMPNVQIRIAPPSPLATCNSQLATAQEGEVQVHAPSMFTGYLTGDSTLTPDGFFPTGDLGRLDPHGNLTITGRIKLLIDVGGLKVNPLEVEAVLRQHPAVAACVVLPLPLTPTISRIKAVIRPADPAHPPSPDDLRAFARARLSPHKIPRTFEFRPSLPTSPTGKILRHLIDA